MRSVCRPRRLLICRDFCFLPAVAGVDQVLECVFCLTILNYRTAHAHSTDPHVTSSAFNSFYRALIFAATRYQRNVPMHWGTGHYTVNIRRNCRGNDCSYSGTPCVLTDCPLFVRGYGLVRRTCRQALPTLAHPNI